MGQRTQSSNILTDTKTINNQLKPFWEFSEQLSPIQFSSAYIL